jgi:fatty-acyl-CoA synthase
MLLDRLVSMARLVPLIHRTLRHKPTSTRTVGDLLEERAAAHPERVFLYCEDRRVTYAALNAAANRVAHWAHGHGLRSGDRVGLMMHNRPEFLFAWLGLAKLGVVTALVNTNLRGRTLAHVLDASRAACLLVGAECLETLATAAQPIADVWAWAEDDPVPSAVAARALGPALAAMPTENPDRAWRESLRAGDDLFYIYTSGTTGFPKPARMSHMRFLAIGDAMAGVAGYGPDDVIYCPLPLYHGAAGAVVPAEALHAGAAIAVRRKFSASGFWDDCRRFRATGFYYVGEVCQFLLARPPRPDDRDHQVRVIMGTGLRPGVWERFQERFGIVRIIESYGSTEANTSVINLDNRPGSIGRIPFRYLHNGRLIRYDADMDTHPRDPRGFCIECRPGEVGEFIGHIRESRDTGARRFEGYLSAEDTERKILRDVFQPGDRWFRTGDLLREDEDGYFYFVDRVGDTFRWRSENVSTQEVGAILGACPGVETANVYGVEVPGEDGRAGMAALVLREGAAFDGAALFAYAGENLPRYAAPLFVRLCQEADVTGSLKLRKVDLQREGYDPERVKDPLFVRDEEARTYSPLTAGSVRPGAPNVPARVG